MNSNEVFFERFLLIYNAISVSFKNLGQVVNKIVVEETTSVKLDCLVSLFISGQLGSGHL